MSKVTSAGVFRRFFHDESAAITVDWVVLTSAIVFLGTLVLIIVAGGVNTAANDVNSEIDQYMPTSKWGLTIKN